MENKENNKNEFVRKVAEQKYEFGFTTDVHTEIIETGLNEDIVRLISAKKNEPEWMLEFRLKAFRYWQTLKQPTWGHVNLPEIDYQAISYYADPMAKKKDNEKKEIDPELMKTFDKLGIPLEERLALSGVAVDAIMDSVSVKTTFKEKLAEKGIIFCSIGDAIQNHPELVKEYLGTVVPYRDNFYAALNCAVFSDGSFVYIPKGVRCPLELSSYFRINARNTGQFERTLIIADDDSYVSYLEGCTAPMRDEKQLPAASVEIIVKEDAEGLDLLVPAFRVDVQRPCDVVEDILRIYGYNNVEIPTQLKSSLTVQGEEDKHYHTQNIVAEQLVGEGFMEILNNSLTKASYYTDFELNAYPDEHTVKVMNPLSADLGVMRQTMLFGGLESVSRNINHKSQNLKFFEVGNTYLYNKEKWDAENPIKGYSQEGHISLFITGKRVEGNWAHADEQSNIYELKAVVENILRRVGMPQNNVVLKHSDNNIFSKGVQYETRAGKVLVEMGILNLKLKKAFDIEQDVFYADVHWDNLMKAIKKVSLTYTDISKYPSVSRDLALLVDKSVEFEQIEMIACQTEKKLLKSVVLFDVYEGKNLPEGKKSYAVNFILQDEEKTLNDKQIDAIMKKLIANLTGKLNAELR